MSKHSSDQHEHKASIDGATRNLALLFCLGALAGILIWAKLRLVTDIPRSAYADPKDQQVDSPMDDIMIDEASEEDQADTSAPRGERKAQP